MKKVREAIPPEERTAAAERTEDRLFGMAALQSANTVLLFSSFGSEIPTDAIARRLQEGNRRVLLPFVEGPDMEAAELRPGDPLVATRYGPREPAERVAVEPGEVDLAVVPGLAFDRLGYRVGYGGGHYDRYLARLGPHALKVGIAFHAQLVPAVPHGREDEPIDFVVTDLVTVDCRTERRAFRGPRQ
jgi:5-formyltetrahydrofolate cyclo-ligase